MSLTGLFLIIFLTEHLIGNFLLFANDNGAIYEAYGDFLISNPLIRFIEVFLFLGIVFHALIGIILWIQNRKARPVKYKIFRLKDNSSFSSRIAILSGSMIFIFLVIHLRSFMILSRFGSEPARTYDLVIQAFSDPWYVAFYLLALLLLGYHLRHGFQSAFQTLGLRNKKYTPLLDAFAFIVWCLIPLGYASIPVYFFWMQKTGLIVSMGAY
jgi:succinate dehydrogenase / fumarate reductase, cytochrome b subunit